jgi:radical SAM superfamily enzyme YgiQ (UPF0313 family)
MKVLLIAYDNDSFTNLFPIGLAYIAKQAQLCGCDVEIYNQDINHYPDSHLTEYLDNNKFDVVGLGVIGGYYQYKKLLSLSNSINRSKNRPLFILGGYGPTPEPEFFLKKTQADIIVLGEGEETFKEILSHLNHRTSWRDCLGIAFREGDTITVNERRPLIADIDSIPLPAYDLFPMDVYRMVRCIDTKRSDFVGVMMSGRGCPFKCNFCYRMDEGFRPRSPEGIIEEIALLNEKYLINYINFQDDLLMSSVERTEKLCHAFIKSKLNFRWVCNGRLNYAKKPLLKLMKEAGCLFINYGIESMDQTVLNNMNKGLTIKQIIDGVEATIDTGISPGLNIIFGNIGDNLNTLQKSVDFLLKYDDQAHLRTIRPVTPYPGSELYYHAIEKGMLKDCEDFYENKHVNSDLMSVNFTNLTDDEFYKALCNANTKLIQNYYDKSKTKALQDTQDLYANLNANFRGFRTV